MAALSQPVQRMRCKKGHDQPYLNHAFQNWTRITSEVWLVQTARRSAKECRGDGPHEPNSFHFFGAAPPWSDGCATCTMQGKICHLWVAMPLPHGPQVPQNSSEDP